MKIAFNDLSRSPDFDSIFFSKLEAVIRKGSFISGTLTREFEVMFAEKFKLSPVKTLSNGTSALGLGLKALNLKQGSNVLISGNSGGYARVAIEAAKLNAVYVDVTDDGLINLKEVLKAKLMRIDALIVTHLYGQLCDMDPLQQYCKKNNIYLIEDCAQAVGANFDGKYAGSWGDISTFSFYPTKNLAAIGDAGAVSAKSPEIFARLKKLSQYGWSEKYTNEIRGGENSRMDEIQAFVLLERLPRLVDANNRRREIWKRYMNSLNAKFRLIGNTSESFVAHLGVIDAGEYRENFRSYLHKSGIETAIHYPIADFHQKAFLDQKIDLPNTLRLCDGIFSIPLYPELTNEEVSYICMVLNKYKP